METINYEKMTPVDLVMELKKLSRSVTALESEKNHVVPNAAEHFVEIARIDAELEDLNVQRVEIGKVMLKLDEERQQREIDRLQQQKQRGAELTTEILGKLPEFSKLVHDALSVIAGDFGELQDLSKELRAVNTRLMNCRVSNAVSGVNHIEPSGLNKLLKQELVRALGENLTNYRVEKPEQNIQQAVEALGDKVVIDE